MLKLLLVSTAVVIGAIFVGVKHMITKVPDPPELDLQKWWGDGVKPETKQDESIRSFKIDFNDTVNINKYGAQISILFCKY